MSHGSAHKVLPSQDRHTQHCPTPARMEKYSKLVFHAIRLTRTTRKIRCLKCTKSTGTSINEDAGEDRCGVSDQTASF